MPEITNRNDTIDTIDLAARVAELTAALQAAGVPVRDMDADDPSPEEDAYWSAHEDGDDHDDERDELARLTDLAEQISDHPEFRAGMALIRDSYFSRHAEEYAESLCDCDSSRWPFTAIDWDKAALDLRQDYSSVDFDGVTYWHRS